MQATESKQVERQRDAIEHRVSRCIRRKEPRLRAVDQAMAQAIAAVMTQMLDKSMPPDCHDIAAYVALHHIK